MSVRGQYTKGAVNGKAVAGFQDNDEYLGSETETFVALQAEINNWRWAGVPFFLRTGKRLSRRYSEIATAGAKGLGDIADKTLVLFFEILGQVAGDLALTLGANGGIFLGGGICQRYPNNLLQSRFRAGFESKGRHRKILEKTPTWLIISTAVFGDINNRPVVALMNPMQ